MCVPQSFADSDGQFFKATKSTCEDAVGFLLKTWGNILLSWNTQCSSDSLEVWFWPLESDVMIHLPHGDPVRKLAGKDIEGALW